jgi:hypothetical protein
MDTSICEIYRACTLLPKTHPVLTKIRVTAPSQKLPFKPVVAFWRCKRPVNGGLVLSD